MDLADQVSQKEGKVRSVRSNRAFFFFFGGRVSGGGISGGTRAASGWEERPQLDTATHEYSTGWVEEEEEGGAPTAQDNKP